MTLLNGMSRDDASSLASDINNIPGRGYATVKQSVPPPAPRYIVIVYNVGPSVPFGTWQHVVDIYHSKLEWEQRRHDQF